MSDAPSVEEWYPCEVSLEGNHQAWAWTQTQGCGDVYTSKLRLLLLAGYGMGALSANPGLH